jgi:hypothetical protein
MKNWEFGAAMVVWGGGGLGQGKIALSGFLQGRESVWVYIEWDVGVGVLSRLRI